MVDFLNDDAVFEGEVTTKAELIVNGGLTVGPGGARVGQPASELSDSWPAHTRVQVANVTERDALVAWRTANDPISAIRPLLVWRADGSLTGLEEITTDGVNWFAESAVAGDIEMTLAESAPYGWVLMQGQLLVNAAVNYPALWANASAALRVGADLRIPDMRGRVPVGAGQGTGLTLRNLGDQIGGETATLTTANLPAHSHTGTTGSADRSLDHNHYTNLGDEIGDNIAGSGRSYAVLPSGAGDVNKVTSNVYQRSSPSTGSTLNHLHPFTTNNTGDGTGHANMQPSLVVNFKVKV